MLNTIVTIPADKITGWHWLDKEHPFKLVSDRARVFYTGMCGETDYHFTLISRTDKEIVLQLKEIVTPARKAPPQPDPAVEQRAEKLLPLLDKIDMARLLVKYEDSNNSLAEQLRDANAKLDAAARTLNTTLDLEKAPERKPYHYQGAESGLPQTSSASNVFPFVRMNADAIGLGSTGMHGSTVLTVTFLSYDRDGTLRSFNAKTSQDAQPLYYFNVVPRTGEIKYVGYGVKA